MRYQRWKNQRAFNKAALKKISEGTRSGLNKKSSLVIGVKEILVIGVKEILQIVFSVFYSMFVKKKIDTHEIRS
jgi:hypothetical protein